MAKTLAQVTADVAAQKTVTDGTVVLIKGLQQQIQEMSANGGATPDQLDALDQQITANTQSLADAVAAGTGAPGTAGAGATADASASGASAGTTGSASTGS